MKRIIRVLLAVIAAAVLLGLGVAWARPGWLPAWARIDFDRLAAWVHPGRPPTRADIADPSPLGGREPDEPRGTVRLASRDLVRRLEIKTAEVARERHAHWLTSNAEVAFDGQRMAEVLSRVSGVLREVKVELGQTVRQGDVLAVAEAALIGSAKVQFLTAREAADLAQATYDRTVRLIRESAAPAKTELENRTALSQAKANLMNAEQTLHTLGFTDAGLERIAAATDTSNHLEIVAPIGGSITLWDATPGEAIEPTTWLFTIVDDTKMWLWIDVHESQIASVRVGQPVTFLISGAKAPPFSGTVTSVGREVNPITRTTRVRAELPNPESRLRANQFGRASIQVEPEHEALVVPTEAVQDDGETQRVFLPQPDGVSFLVRTVVTRPLEDIGRVEIVQGLGLGDRVVTRGSFLLISDLQKDSIPDDVD